MAKQEKNEQLKTVRIPLIGAYTQRNSNAYATLTSTLKDQRFSGGTFTFTKNPLSETITSFFEKRTGWVTDTTIAGGSGLAGNNIFVDKTNQSFYSNFGTKVFDTAGVEIGTLPSSFVSAFTETSGYILISNQANGAAHFYFDTSIATGTTSFECDVTSGSPNLTSVTGANLTNLKPGQLLSGTGIPSTARIQSYSAGTIVMGTDSATTINATATNTGVTVTYEFIQLIMSTNFRAQDMIGPMIEMDGYLFMQSVAGKIFNSDLNAFQTWQSTSFLDTLRVFDYGGGLFRYKNLLGAFNSGSIEFFENIGNATGSPLIRVAQLALNQGTNKAGIYPSFCTLRDLVFWTSIAQGVGTTGVWMLDDQMKINRISTPIIERIFTEAGHSFDVINAFEYNGQSFVYIGGASGTLFVSFLYCIETGIWTESGFPQNFVIANGDKQPVGVAKSNTTGIIYRWSQGASVTAVAYQDQGAVPISITIQTSKIDFGTSKYKRFHKIRLIGDRATAAATVNMSWSDDDYQTFNTARSVDMANNDAYLNACGIARRRAFRLTNSSNTALRLEALEITYSECNK